MLTPEEQTSYHSACKVLELFKLPIPTPEMWLKAYGLERTIKEAFAEDDVADMLGLTYIDTITGFDGTCVMVGQDIDGLVQALIQPECSKNNIITTAEWFVITRLKKV